MENLRAAIERDLGDSLEGEFKIDVELTSPDGEKQVYTKGSTTVKLGGQVLYSSRRENPSTGEVVVVNQAVVSLRVTSLDRVPAPGENWGVKIPITPAPDAPAIWYVATATRAPEHGTDIGFINLYVQRIAPTDEPVST